MERSITISGMKRLIAAIHQLQLALKPSMLGVTRFCAADLFCRFTP